MSPKIIAEESKGISITNKSLTVLGEDYDNVFTIQINDEDLLKSLNIDINTLINYFSLIY